MAKKPNGGYSLPTDRDIAYMIDWNQCFVCNTCGQHLEVPQTYRTRQADTGRMVTNLTFMAGGSYYSMLRCGHTWGLRGDLSYVATYSNVHELGTLASDYKYETKAAWTETVNHPEEGHTEKTPVDGTWV